MEILITLILCIIIFGLILTISTFVIEKYIDKKSDNNKFKKWWRKNIVAEQL